VRRVIPLSLALLAGACVSRLIVDEDGVADGGQDGRSDDDAGDGDHDDDEDDGVSFSDSGIGDLPDECDVESHDQDCDSDGLPDGDDPMPEDPNGAGAARTDVIYVHSGYTLWTFDPLTFDADIVGDFEIEGDDGGQILDIAIDRFGLLYAANFGGVYVCDPDSVVCSPLGNISTNSLGFVPAGILDPVDDVLMAVAGNRVIHAILAGPAVTIVDVGEVDSPYASSGDVAALPDGRVVFTSPSPAGDDVVVVVDPATAAVESQLAPARPSTWGLATWGGALWAFDAQGTVRRYDPVTFAPQDVTFVPVGVYGAAAHPAAAD
jgi:hypothetical protein